MPVPANFLPLTPIQPLDRGSTTTTKQTVVVSGIVGDSRFQKAKAIAEAVSETNPSLLHTISPFPPTAFHLHTHTLRDTYPQLTTLPRLFRTALIELHTTSTTTTPGVNKTKTTTTKTNKQAQTLAQFSKWATEQGVDLDGLDTEEEFERMGRREWNAFLTNLGAVVELEFVDEKNGEVIGPPVVIELFKKTCPKSVEHFLGLVEGRNGVGYKGSKVSRIVKGGWIECGAITDQKGTAIQEPLLEDENYIHPHDPYTLAYIPLDTPHTNSTPFLITLASMPYFHKRYVAFGRVLDGFETLERVGSVETKLERPVRDVVIGRAGVWREE